MTSSPSPLLAPTETSSDVNDRRISTEDDGHLTGPQWASAKEKPVRQEGKGQLQEERPQQPQSQIKKTEEEQTFASPLIASSSYGLPNRFDRQLSILSNHSDADVFNTPLNGENIVEGDTTAGEKEEIDDALSCDSLTSGAEGDSLNSPEYDYLYDNDSFAADDEVGDDKGDQCGHFLVRSDDTDAKASTEGVCGCNGEIFVTAAIASEGATEVEAPEAIGTGAGTSLRGRAEPAALKVKAPPPRGDADSPPPGSVHSSQLTSLSPPPLSMKSSNENYESNTATTGVGSCFPYGDAPPATGGGGGRTRSGTECGYLYYAGGISLGGYSGGSGSHVAPRDGRIGGGGSAAGGGGGGVGRRPPLPPARLPPHYPHASHIRSSSPSPLQQFVGPPLSHRRVASSGDVSFLSTLTDPDSSVGEHDHHAGGGGGGTAVPGVIAAVGSSSQSSGVGGGAGAPAFRPDRNRKRGVSFDFDVNFGGGGIYHGGVTTYSDQGHPPFHQPDLQGEEELTAFETMGILQPILMDDDGTTGGETPVSGLRLGIGGGVGVGALGTTHYVGGGNSALAADNEKNTRDGFVSVAKTAVASTLPPPARSTMTPQAPSTPSPSGTAAFRKRSPPAVFSSAASVASGGKASPITKKAAGKKKTLLSKSKISDVIGQKLSGFGTSKTKETTRYGSEDDSTS